jgi:hypothetical protein
MSIVPGSKEEEYIEELKRKYPKKQGNRRNKKKVKRVKKHAGKKRKR